MKATAIVLLIVGIIFAGLGFAYYSQYSREKGWALKPLDKSHELADQAMAARDATEADRLVKEAKKAYSEYKSSLDVAQQPKGYAIMNWIISGVAILLSITLLIISSRRRKLNSSVPGMSPTGSIY